MMSLAGNGSSGGSVPTCTMRAPRRTADRQPASAAGCPAASIATSTCPFQALVSGCASSAPTVSAISRARSLGSLHSTRPAPASRAAITDIQPMVPAPVTSTVAPSKGPARRTACSPTDSGSAQAISPRPTSSSTAVSCDSPTTKCSRNRPGRCGKIAALPRNTIFSQRLLRPARQAGHRPQGWAGFTATFWPGRTRVTPGPMASTTPEASWPGTKGARMEKAPARPCW